MDFVQSKNIKKAYLLIAFFVVFGCFYNFYKTSFAAHHCDDSEHCEICQSLHILNDESPTPLGANLNNNNLLFFGITVFSFVVFIYKELIIKSTPVTNRVKKTE